MNLNDMEELDVLADTMDQAAESVFKFLDDRYPFESDINIDARKTWELVSYLKGNIENSRYDDNGKLHDPDD